MTVLVTGGAGFIGSNIVDSLIKKNYNVVILDNLSTGKKEYINNKAKFYEMNVETKEINKIFEKEDIDYVIHTAAQIDVQKSIKDPLTDCITNILGTVNLLEKCAKYNIKKIIYSSSAAVYGTPNYLPIDEKHPMEAISGYGISKHTPEHYIKMYHNLHEVDYTILRYANVYGPRQDPKGEGGVISIFVDRMLTGLNPIIYGDGKQTRDFIYVKDIVDANINSLKIDKNGTFNISRNEKSSINELFKIINELLDRNLSPIYKEERKGDIKHSVLDNTKAIQNLKWEPKYNLKTGLEKTIDYYK